MLMFVFLYSIPAFAIGFALFVLLILFYWLGFQLRQRSDQRNNDSNEELGATSGTLLGLLALLLAFSFGMANSRFDTRRTLVIEEVNAISTVILRSDLLPDSVRLLFRSTMRDYLEARINFFEARADRLKVIAATRESEILGKRLWDIATNYVQVNAMTVHTSQLIPALNLLLDLNTTRKAAWESSIPTSILYFLIALCVCSAILLGYDRKNKFDWIVVTGFALMLSMTVFTIIDLDRPRRGLITLEKQNQMIVDLRNMLNQ